jgi:hypothetical protein
MRQIRPTVTALTALLLLAAAASPAPAAPGSEAQAFSTMRWTLYGNLNSHAERLHEYWDPGPGLHGQLRMPFYAGEFLSGAQLLPYDGEPGERPSFLSTHYYLGWGWPLHLPAGFTLLAGGSFGSLRMKGAEEELPAGEERWAETEFAASLRLDLAWAFSGRSALHLEAHRTTVFTHHRLQLLHVGLGISHRFATPAPVQEALR